MSPFSHAVGKSPGRDKLSFGAVLLLLEWERKRIMEIAKAVVRTGLHTMVWKWASGVVICKPGLDDYTNLKAYSFIAQLSCIGKVVEKVVAELLAKEAGIRELLSNGQYGNRKRRLAINVAAIMVDWAHPAWREARIAGVLLMDIKTAFRSVGRGRQIHTMRGKGMDWDLVRWTASSLTDRTVKTVLKGNVMERHPMEVSVPHGSLVSPILFAIYTSGVIKRAKVKVSRSEGLSLVDVVGWVVSGNDINQVIRTLEACARVSIDWVERRELQFDTAETEGALFTRRLGHKKHLRVKLSVKIRVGNGFVRFDREATRCLGVLMDAHLMFTVLHNR